MGPHSEKYFGVCSLSTLSCDQAGVHAVAVMIMWYLCGLCTHPVHLPACMLACMLVCLVLNPCVCSAKDGVV